MRDAAFADLRRQLFERYRSGDYAGAMATAQSAAASFPDRDDQTTYWIACLSVLQGRQNVGRVSDPMR
jgi:hypothetical protein